MLTLCRPCHCPSWRSQGCCYYPTRDLSSSICWHFIVLVSNTFLHILNDNLIEFVRFGILSSVTGGVRRLMSLVVSLRMFCSFLHGVYVLLPTLIPFYSCYRFAWPASDSIFFSLFLFFSDRNFNLLPPLIYFMFVFHVPPWQKSGMLPLLIPVLPRRSSATEVASAHGAQKTFTRPNSCSLMLWRSWVCLYSLPLGLWILDSWVWPVRIMY